MVTQSVLDMGPHCYFWTGLCCPRAGKCGPSVLYCVCSLAGASRHGRFEKGTRADRKRLGQAPRVAALYFCERNKEGYLGEKQGRSCFLVPTEAKLINYTSLWSTVPGSCPDLPGISSSPRRSCCCPHQRGLGLIHNLPFLIRPRDEGDDY